MKINPLLKTLLIAIPLVTLTACSHKKGSTSGATDGMAGQGVETSGLDSGLSADEQARQQFEQIRCQILTQKRDENVVREEVLKMRQKMKDHLGSSSEQKKHGIFHLKQDAGGIVDIEFMAQYGVLAWSGANPDLTRFSDNVRLLNDMATAGCLSRSDAEALTDAYLRERAETHRLALAQKPLTVSAAEWRATRKTVHDLWQRLIDPAAAPLEP